MKKMLFSLLLLSLSGIAADASTDRCRTQLTHPETHNALEAFDGTTCEDSYKLCTNHVQKHETCGICENSEQDSGMIGQCQTLTSSRKTDVRPPHEGKWDKKDGYYRPGPHYRPEYRPGAWHRPRPWIYNKNYTYKKYYGYPGYYYHGHHGGYGGYYYNGLHFSIGNGGLYNYGSYYDCPVSLYRRGYYISTYHGSSCRIAWQRCYFASGNYGSCVGG